MKTTHISVRAWESGGLLFERYDYAPGPAGLTASHSHEEYQFCLSFNTPGSYNYRGARHVVPQRSLSVLHPGEMHSAQDLEPRTDWAQFWMIYVPSVVMLLAAQQLSQRRSNEAPFVAEPVHLDRKIFNAFVGFHELMGKGAAALEQESQVLDTLARFLARTGAVREQFPARAERRPQAVPRLPSNAGTAAARLSDAIACRARKVVDLATRTAGTGGHAMRFYDQSHLNAHFKRLVSVTPGRYLPQSDARRRQERPRQRD